MQAEQLASRCGSMVGVMAVSSHPATTTAGVVGGSCDVASGERDRERLTASGGQSRASIVRGPVRRAEWHCRRATPSASETEKSKRKPQIGAKKGLWRMKCMRLWASGSVHQRVPRRSTSADRRPHTGPRQRTRERVHLLPHPFPTYGYGSTGRRVCRVNVHTHGAINCAMTPVDDGDDLDERVDKSRPSPPRRSDV